jgi:uncharacterized protein
MSSAILTSVGLVFVIEGLTYALVPGQLKRMMASMLNLSDEQFRFAGAGALAVGVLIVWFAQKLMNV